MQYPYNDDNMIFNYVTHRYVLTEKGVRAYAAVSLGESFKSDVANSITAFLNLASQQTYNIIHSYNVNTEVQDYIIATTKSGREMIQEAMINRLLFLLTERKIFDEAFYSVITRILPEINTSICYSGQVFRLDKPIKWEELSGEEESESSLVLIDKTITANGVYNANSEEVGGQTVDGYRMVEVDVQPNLQVGTGTVNGETYYPSQGYDGFSEFTVNVPVDTRVQHNIHLFGETSTQRLDCYFTITNQDRTNYSTMELLYNALVKMNKGYSEQTAVDASGTYIDDQLSHTIIKIYVLKGISSGQTVYSPIAIDSDGTTLFWGNNSINVTDTLISESAKLLEQKNITQNGLYAADDEGYDGYRSVYVNVPAGGTPRLQSKTAQASSVQQVITYDTGYDGLQKVTIGAISGTYTILSNGEYDIAQYGKVSVNVETANIGAITAELTENRTYNASDYGFSGISSFTVNVPQKLRNFVEDTLTEITASDIDGATTIKRMSFSERNALTKVEIPNTVTSVEQWAFDACDYLKDVTINGGANRITINSEAFFGCPLTNIVIDCTNGNYSVILQDKCFSTAATMQCVVTILDDDRDPKAVFQGKPFPNAGDASKLIIKVSSMWLSAYRNSNPDYANNFVVNDNE